VCRSSEGIRECLEVPDRGSLILAASVGGLAIGFHFPGCLMQRPAGATGGPRAAAPLINHASGSRERRLLRANGVEFGSPRRDEPLKSRDNVETTCNADKVAEPHRQACGKPGAHAAHDAGNEPGEAGRCARPHLPASTEIRKGYKPDRREPAPAYLSHPTGPACDERCFFEIQDSVDDILRLTHSTHGLQSSEKLVRRRRMH
jgi:hypothetical protein